MLLQFGSGRALSLSPLCTFYICWNWFFQLNCISWFNSLLEKRKSGCFCIRNQNIFKVEKHCESSSMSTELRRRKYRSEGSSTSLEKDNVVKLKQEVGFASLLCLTRSLPRSLTFLFMIDHIPAWKYVFIMRSFTSFPSWFLLTKTGLKIELVASTITPCAFVICRLTLLRFSRSYQSIIRKPGRKVSKSSNAWSNLTTFQQSVWRWQNTECFVVAPHAWLF